MTKLLMSSAKFIPPGFARQEGNGLLYVYCQERIPANTENKYWENRNESRECSWDYDDVRSYKEGVGYWIEHWEDSHWWEKDVS